MILSMADCGFKSIDVKINRTIKMKNDLGKIKKHLFNIF